MKTFELSDDEFETLGDAFRDVGCDCPGVDWDKFKSLGVKLGIFEPEKPPPTAEELKRREEVVNSPFAKAMKELFTRSNEQMMQIAARNILDAQFFEGKQWPISTNLRIRLPNDYK